MLLRHLNTKNGRLVFKIYPDQNRTEVFESENMAKVATIKSADRKEVMRAIRSLGTFLKKHTALNLMGIQFEASALKLLTGVLSIEKKTPSTIPVVGTEREYVEPKTEQFDVPKPKRIRTSKVSW